MADQKKVLQSFEEVLSFILFRNDTIALNGRDILKTLLDVGLLHHYFCLRISLSPTSKSQSEWLDDYFKQLYISRYSLNAELSDLINGPSADIDSLMALRLLNISTFTTIVSSETSIRIISLLPELLSTYAISLFISELDSHSIIRYLAPFTSLGNPDVNSVYALANLEANDSSTRCKETVHIQLNSFKNSFAELYNCYRDLLIARGTRSIKSIQSRFLALVTIAPGFHRAYSALLSYSPSTIYHSASSPGQSCDLVSVDQYRGFLLPFADALLNKAYTTNSFPLTTVYLIREVSEFCDIVPLQIRSRFKRAAAYLFLKAGKHKEWRTMCEPLLSEEIEKSNSYGRLDPFALELFVEDAVQYVSSLDSIDILHQDYSRYLWLCGSSPTANISTAHKLSNILKHEGYEVGFLGYTDMLQSVAFTLSRTYDTDIFSTANYWLDYSKEIEDYINDQLEATLSSTSTSTKKLFIICDENCLYWLPLAPYLVSKSTVLSLLPSQKETLYLSIHELYGYRVPRHMTPSLADAIFHERLCQHLLSSLQKAYPHNVWQYPVNDHSCLSNLDTIQFLLETGYAKSTSSSLAHFLAGMNTHSDLAISDHSISAQLRNNQDYHKWLSDNMEDLNLLSEPWQPL